MSVRFPVSQGIPIRVPNLVPTSRLWSWLMRTRGIRNGEGDVNHERILVSGTAGLESTAQTGAGDYEEEHVLATHVRGHVFSRAVGLPVILRGCMPP